MDLKFSSDSPAIGASSYTNTCLTCDGLHGARMRFHFSARIGIECPIIYFLTQTMPFKVVYSLWQGSLGREQ